MSQLGLFLPGSSPLHRVHAGVKLAGLAAAVVVLVALNDPRRLGLAVLVVTGLYVVARVPARMALRQLRPLLWMCVFLFGLQVLLTDWMRALSVVLTLLLTVALAALVTLTTRVTDMLEVAEAVLRPLRRVGVAPDRVGLVLALTIRGVPVVTGLAGTVRQAHQARGLPGTPFTTLVPVLVRVLRHADALGEALAARGLDDDRVDDDRG